MKKISLLLITALLFVGLTGCTGQEDVKVGLGTSSKTTTEKTTTPTTPTTTIPDPITTETMTEEKTITNRHAIIQTNLGTMELELFEQRAPITTKNFIDLAEKDYFNGIIFHRVIEDFMIQGGDPTGTGMGGPGHTIEDEFHPELKHSTAGVLSMANSGPDSGGSQFFITLVPTTFLDGKHAVFGKIVKGEDILQKIGSVETDAGDRPLEEVVMEKVTIK